MTTKSGESVRSDLLEKFQIQHVDFGDTRLFEAAVLPASITFRKPENIDPKQEIHFQLYISFPITNKLLIRKVGI